MTPDGAPEGCNGEGCEMRSGNARGTSGAVTSISGPPAALGVDLVHAQAITAAVGHYGDVDLVDLAVTAP